MLELFKKEAKWPFKDVNQFLIGCIMYLLSFLVLPWIAIYGYVVRVYRNTLKKKEFPLFSDLKNLLLEGLKAALIMIAYLSVSLILSFTILFLIIQSYAAADSWPSIEEFNAEYVAMTYSPLMILSMVFFYIGSFFTPMATLYFAKEGKLKSGFKLKSIIKSISLSMPAYLLIYFIVMIVDYLIGLLTGNYFFNLIQPIVGFYMLVYSSRLFAKVYKTDKGK